MRMTTPDPTTAAFYAQALYAKTNGRRPDDAYLAARAMSLKGEGKRAIWILDKSGLIGFGVGSGTDHNVNNNNHDSNNEDGGVGTGLDQSVQSQQQQQQQHSIHSISNKDGIRNALLLRTEAALLAGQCLLQSGEYERGGCIDTAKEGQVSARRFLQRCQKLGVWNLQKPSKSLDVVDLYLSFDQPICL